MAETVRDLLQPHAADAAAILAPERPTLTFGGLRELADATVAKLNALGIGRGDRVAIVLPNGPEMATAFVAVACGATTAPLNPAYRAEEFEFYLSDLGAKALIVARRRARRRRSTWRAGSACAILRLVDGRRPAGRLVRARRPRAPAARRSRAGAGAGGRRWRWCCTPRARPRGPKIVPLRQRNLAASARHIRAHAGADAGGPLPQHHAAVPHPRPDRGGAVLAVGRRLDLLHAGLQRAELLPLAR